VLGDELGVLTQAIAGALDLDDHGVVQEPVEERGGHHRVGEDLAPLGKAPVRGEDHRAPLVASVDQLEEQAAAIGHDRQVADLVDDQERSAAEEADLVAQPALALGLGERGNEVGKGDEVDAAPGLDRLDSEGDRKVALARAGRPEQVDDLMAVDEVELGEGQDAVAVERRLEGEVEAGKRLDGREPGHTPAELGRTIHSFVLGS
jgi:hypothetical protein